MTMKLGRMKMPRKRYLGIGILVILASIAALTYQWAFPPAHQHCIKQAILLFSFYASENDGRFPESEKGWGDALLKLGEIDEESDYWIPYIVGIDDDGSHLLNAIAQGSDVDETRCTRVYVQGLTQNSHSKTTILFDRESEPGGDHFRCRFREPLREIITVGGSHKMIKDRDWPEYVKKQRELLRDQGFNEAKIDEIYGPYK